MNILEKVGIQKVLDLQNELLEELAVTIPAMKTLGLNDRTPVVDEKESTNPTLRALIHSVIDGFKEKFGDSTSFRASEVVEGARKRTLIFGIENGVYRCLDTAEIVQKGI